MLQNTIVAGLPVRGPQHLDRTDIVVPASGLQAVIQSEQLRSLGIANIISVSEFFYLTRCKTQPEKDYLADLWRNRLHYVTLYLALDDAESRRVLNGVLQHRVSMALEPLAKIMDSDHPQWFDSKFMAFRADQVFVDGGAFDGDTVRSFVKAHGTPYRSIHAFEPDPVLAERARVNLREFANVTVHTLGLGRGPGRSHFASTGGTDGRLAQHGGSVILIDSIDRIVTEPATYLKLDVEGAEAAAIAGARRHIMQDHPAIAVAAYHKATDLWKLPAQLLSIGQSYILNLRHYTQVAFETVLYATPH
jgi:FkbM family methyltransferase